MNNLKEDKKASQVFLPIPTSFYLLPSYSNSLNELPFFSELLLVPSSSESIRNYIFKIKPSEDPNAKPLISPVSWTKAESQAIVKDFPGVIEDPHRFAKEFYIVILT